ncbi:MAG TPA: dTDP-4-dehydrorhamnose 3,5-epimerase [Scandinavium sp.]|jgi:dTDP-4-dehydrorhamnose 3,5-epimerase
MKVTKTDIPDLLIIEPQVFGDERGFFYESFNQQKFDEAIGRKVNFVQDNHSKSSKGVLRGLHFQSKDVQAKLVRVIAGAVYDVVVDLRNDSSTRGKWFGIELSADNKKQLWIPEGFAHGFLVLDDNTEFVYKCNNFYNPNFEHTLLWNDPKINIHWPIVENSKLTISRKDLAGKNYSTENYFSAVDSI